MGFLSSFFCEFIINMQKSCLLCLPCNLCSGFSTCNIKSSAKTDNLTSSFPTLMLIISFSSRITLAKSSSTILNKNGKSWHLCLVLDLKVNTFSFSPFYVILAVGLWYITFVILRDIPSIPNLWKAFITKGYTVLSNVFSVLIETTIWFLFFILLMWFMMIIDLWMLNHLWISGINLTWSWCMIFFLWVWNQFVSILLRIFASSRI